MSRETSGSGRMKTYGICINDKCEHYKEIQEVRHGEMVCSCGKRLSPCSPPRKKRSKLPLIIGAAVALVVVLVGLIIAFVGRDSKPETEPEALPTTDSVATEPKVDTVTIVRNDTIRQTDTVTVEKTVVKVESPKAAKTASSPSAAPKAARPAEAAKGTVRLSYGIYKGDTKNGYPDGMGRLTYSVGRQINRYDSKSRTASAGDYVIGEFVRGFFIQGKHYASDGTLLETIMIGTPATSAYESK